MKSTQAQLKLCVSNMGNMSTKGFPKPLCKETGGKDQTTQREEQGFSFHASSNGSKTLVPGNTSHF